MTLHSGAKLNAFCKVSITGKSLSEALIFASTNSQYDDRLFIELQVQFMKIPSSNLGRTCSAKRRASDKDLPVNNSIADIAADPDIVNCFDWILDEFIFFFF